MLRFSRRLRELRKAAGISQKELGRRAYVTEDFVGRMELAKQFPSLETMALLALALDCDVLDLLVPES
ncbi:MAG TPA: helix-turn-helix transcriptional regulator [Vicinamibacterales bacterium]|nr:helix-turn-helix transcriptional regulator [Vicinamibacterales bacterium]